MVGLPATLQGSSHFYLLLLALLLARSSSC